MSTPADKVPSSVEPHASASAPPPINTQTPPVNPPAPIGATSTAPHDTVDPERMRRFFLGRLFPGQSGEQERWDEMCFVAYKQTNERRRRGLEPKTQLICFAKRPPGDDQKDHLHLILSDDFDETTRHIESMTQDMANIKVDDSVLSGTVHCDLTYEIGSRIDRSQEYMINLFRPHSELVRRYCESWGNGSQGKIIKKYMVSVFSGDPIRLLEQYRKRWVQWLERTDK